ncbi:MAG: hypothetical protein AAFW47_07540 [Pseudomonadota bacterium]
MAVMGLKDRLSTLPGVIAALGLYGLLHATMRLTASSNLGENDPLSVLQTQSVHALLQSEGIIFDALVFALAEILGPSALVFQILRYGLLAIALAFVFLIARRATGSGLWALLTVESYALIYQISWRFHEGFTYPLVAMVAVAGTFWAYGKLRDGERSAYAWLAVFSIIGMTTGVWYALFAASCAVTIGLRGGNSLAASWLATIPIVWIIVLEGLAPAGLLGHVSEKELFDGFDVSLDGALKAASAILAYLSPFLVIVILLFARSLADRLGETHHDIRIIKLASIIAAIGLIAIGGLNGRADYAEHALMPVFFLTPIWIMDAVRRSMPSDIAVKTYILICLALMVVAFGARAANLYVLDPVCKRCYFGIPYEGLADTISKMRDISPQAPIIADSDRLAGNLTSFWAGDHRVFRTASSLENLDRFSGGALLVWDETRGGGALPARLGNLAAERRDAVLANTRTIEVPWRHMWRVTGYRQSVWKVSILPPLDDDESQ